MKRLAYLSIGFGIILVLIGTACQKHKMQKNQNIISESNESKSVEVGEEETFILQIPKASNHWTIKIQDSEGNVKAEYRGQIDIVNDGRNGENINITITVPGENWR